MYGIADVVSTMMAADAVTNIDIDLSSDCYPHWNLVSLAQIGFWLTVTAIAAISAYHLLRSPNLRQWIAQQRMAWTLRHASSRPRRRHPARRP